MAKFTKEFWRISVVPIGNKKDETEANAKLIAESPTMFAHLRKIKASLLVSGRDIENMDDDNAISITVSGKEAKGILETIRKVEG